MLGLATNRCCRMAGDEQPVNQTAMRLRPANKRFRRAAALFRIVGLVAMLFTYKRTDEAVYSLQNKKTFAVRRGEEDRSDSIADGSSSRAARTSPVQ